MTELIVHNAVDTSPKYIKFTILSFNLMYNMLGVSNYPSDIDNTLLGFFGIHASLKSFTLITLSSIIKKKKNVPRRNLHSTQVLLYSLNRLKFPWKHCTIFFCLYVVWFCSS